MHMNFNFTDKNIDDLHEGFNSTVEINLSKTKLKHGKRNTLKL